MWVELSYCISFIVTWVFLLYTSLLLIDGLWLKLSYCTSFIVFEIRHCHYYSVNAHAKISAIFLTNLLCCLAMWKKAERVQIHATSDRECQNHCQKLASLVFGIQKIFMNKYYSVFGIRYSEMFHERILFGIQYLEILHERIYSVFSIQKIFMNEYYSVFGNYSWSNIFGIRLGQIHYSVQLCKTWLHSGIRQCAIAEAHCIIRGGGTSPQFCTTVPRTL